ncbi:hypothetical protein VNO80_33236 [Phaseolus coccineus]|uniref:Uncharacterized protein n=1 Tax=Phaseolus coccineus TaxID=3886 RepID=A0AAN9KZH4_PHACN
MKLILAQALVRVSECQSRCARVPSAPGAINPARFPAFELAVGLQALGGQRRNPRTGACLPLDRLPNVGKGLDGDSAAGAAPTGKRFRSLPPPLTCQRPSFGQHTRSSDMYRVLEHLVGRLKDRRRVPDAISAMFSTPGPSAAQILGHLEGQFNRLPAVYRSARVMTGDDRQDSFGFQAANIAITLQTVKLALAGTENQSVGRKCEIAGELLDVLAAIPTSYIMAISTPMGRLSQWAMIQVRNVLIAMIDLLYGLERSLSLGSDVAVKLRGHVAQIETYMEQAAMTAQQSQVFHSVVPRYSPDRNNQTSTGTFRNAPGPEFTVNDSNSGHDFLFPANLDLWSNDFTFDWPSDHQTALQADLTQNWPFDFGGGMNDLLGLGGADLLDNAVQGGIQAEADPSSSIGT